MTTQKPTVSVIIPAHNCKKYLPEAFQTVADQGVDGVEVVVVDDGSTDGTWDYLLSVKDSLPFTLVSLQLGGEGPGAARNAAIQAAGGDLLAFLDADDRWSKTKLRAQLEFHQVNPDVVITFTDYLHVTEENEDLGECFQYWPRFYDETAGTIGYRSLGERAPALIFAENVVGTSTVMAKRQVILEQGGFDATLRSAQDWDLWMRLALVGDVGCTDAVDGYYLMRKGSVTGNVPLRLKCMREVVSRYEQKVAAIDADCVAAAKARIATGEAEHARAENRFWNAFAWHWDAWVKAPSYRAFRSMLRDAVGVIIRR